MDLKRNFVYALLAACSALGTVPAALADETAGTPAGGAVIHQAPSGARLFAVPVLEPGKKAWVTVYDEAGRPASAVSVLINGTPKDTDNMGQCAFDVPKAETMSLALAGSDGKAVNAVNYCTTSGGLLVAQKDMCDAVDRLEDTIVSNEMAPAIANAPAVVETSQPFVIIGKNLSGAADGDHVILDGYDADVFSGSSVCLLATPPRRMSLGPLRELYVTARGESSNTLEVDVCKIDIALSKGSDGQDDVAKVKVIGTNVPTLITIHNVEPTIAALVFNSKALGASCTFITPGGEANNVSLGIKHLAPGAPELDTHLIGDAPWSPDERTIFGDKDLRSIVRELNKAEIMRLKRRAIALETRTNDEQERRTKGLAAGTLSANELDKITTELRSLSNRRHRLNTMIVARRSVFQALGGTDSEYREAIEEANGNSTIALEKTLSPLASQALLASTTVPIISHPTATAKVTENARATVVADDSMSPDELQQSLATLNNIWKKMPNKVAHSTRLAPPPEPYVPNAAQLGSLPVQINYTQYGNLSHLPPPPMVLRELMENGHQKNHAQHGAPPSRKGSTSKGSHKRSSTRHKHH